jgi:hypothetical protein
MSRIATSLKNLLSFRSPLSSEKEKPADDDRQPGGSPGENDNDEHDNNNNHHQRQRLGTNSVDDIADDDFMGDETQLPYPVHYQHPESPKLDNTNGEEQEGAANAEGANDSVVNRELFEDDEDDDAAAVHDGKKSHEKRPAKSRAGSFPDLPSVEEANLSFQQGADVGGPQQPLARPVLDEINADVADWICHVCLSQGDPTLVQDDARALAALLRTSKVALTAQQALRMAITSFYVNLCGVVATAGDEDANDEDEFIAVCLESGEWADLDEQFAELSRKMARFAGNSAGGPTAADPHAQEIVRLIKVQSMLALLTMDMDQVLKERPSSVRSEAEVVLNSHLQRLEIVYKEEPWSVPDVLVVCSPDRAPTSSSGVARVIRTVKQVVSTGEFSQGVLERKVRVTLCVNCTTSCWRFKTNVFGDRFKRTSSIGCLRTWKPLRW